MQLQRIRAPVRLRFPGKSRDQKSRHVVPRNTVGCRILERPRVGDSARRMGDVLDKWQDLRHRHAEPGDDGSEHDGEPSQAWGERLGGLLAEGQIQREQGRRDEEIIRRLDVRAQQAQRDRDREERIAPRPLVSQRRQQRQAREWQQRRDEQLPVVARPGVRDEDAGQLVGEPPHHRADPRDLQPAQEQECE